MARKKTYKKWLWLFAAIIIIIAMWQLLSHFFKEEERELRSIVREQAIATFPEQAKSFSATTGLIQFDSVPVATDRGCQKDVALIHGLDDPGMVWMNLAPALAEQGCTVWIMTYPNDQPIDLSAQLFLSEITKLKKNGIESLAVVAHSMGGLVTREMLTNPDLAYADKVTSGKVPPLTDLIMVGTPNHGSQMVRLRFLGEFRDQITRFAGGDSNWLAFILDGAGEAKIDLLPDSTFLRQLNARPHADGVNMVVIAGITSPWGADEIDSTLGSLPEQIPALEGTDLTSLSSFMTSMVNNLGDGLVTVASAQLEDIPLLRVHGTHLTMIRNITEESERVPPAVPLVLELLGIGTTNGESNQLNQ